MILSLPTSVSSLHPRHPSFLYVAAARAFGKNSFIPAVSPRVEDAFYSHDASSDRIARGCIFPPSDEILRFNIQADLTLTFCHVTYHQCCINRIEQAICDNLEISIFTTQYFLATYERFKNDVYKTLSSRRVFCLSTCLMFVYDSARLDIAIKHLLPAAQVLRISKRRAEERRKCPVRSHTYRHTYSYTGPFSVFSALRFVLKHANLDSYCPR